MVNHGSLTWGRTLPIAMMRHYYYVRSCRIQARAMAAAAGGAEINVPPADVVEEMVRRWEEDDPKFVGERAHVI